MGQLFYTHLIMSQHESQFDASSDPFDPRQVAGEQTSGNPSRPFLGIRFQCCRAYGRIYRNDAMTAYTGHCPKCRGEVTVPIGDGGSSRRFFNAQ